MLLAQTIAVVLDAEGAQRIGQCADFHAQPGGHPCAASVAWPPSQTTAGQHLHQRVKSDGGRRVPS
ncbi:MAG TPA: hypothetical protein VFP27_18655 [Mycobacterium sp.]|nr:hypothetical protein [Mycobacterium sp.]